MSRLARLIRCPLAVVSFLSRNTNYSSHLFYGHSLASTEITLFNILGNPIEHKLRDTPFGKEAMLLAFALLLDFVEAFLVVHCTNQID